MSLTLLSGPIISFIALLLWPDTLGMATAGPACVLSPEEAGPIFAQCRGPRSPIDLPTAPDGAWQCGKFPNRDCDFNFNFTGSPVVVQFPAHSEDLDSVTNENMSIDYSIDQEEATVVEVSQCGKIWEKFLLLQFIVQGRPNGQHTLNGSLRIPLTISIDCRMYIYEDGTHDSPNNAVSGTGSVITSSTNANEATTKPSGGTFHSGDASSANLGAIIGGIVSGITVLTLAIASVLWYRFKKNSKPRSSQFTAPRIEDLPSTSIPPKSTRSRSMTYDPPGYTEKNAYFGIEPSLGNSSALSPNAPEKGFDTASPPLLLA